MNPKNNPLASMVTMTMGLAQNSEQVVTPNSRAYRIRKCRQSLTAHSRVGNPCWCGSPSIMARLAWWVYRDAGQRLQHDPSRKVSGFKCSGTSQRRVDWPTGLTQTTPVALGRISRFSQLGTQIFGKRSSGIKRRINCASWRWVFCLRMRSVESLDTFILRTTPTRSSSVRVENQL